MSSHAVILALIPRTFDIYRKCTSFVHTGWIDYTENNFQPYVHGPFSPHMGELYASNCEAKGLGVILGRSDASGHFVSEKLCYFRVSISSKVFTPFLPHLIPALDVQGTDLTHLYGAMKAGGMHTNSDEYWTITLAICESTKTWLAPVF